MNVLKVAAQSKPTAVAGAVAGLIREDGRAELQAIGAGAVNQAIKAIAISRSYLSPQRMDVICVPTFMEVEINNSQRTGLRLVVQRWDYDEVHDIAGTNSNGHGHSWAENSGPEETSEDQRSNMSF